MLTQAILLWSHSLAALLFGLLALWALRRERAGLPRLPLAAALALTGFWALAVAGIGADDIVTRMASGARNIGWLIFLLIAQRRLAGGAPSTLIAVHAVTMLVIGASILLFLAAEAAPQPQAAALYASAALMLRLMATLAALVLLQTLYPHAESASARLVLLGVAALWLVDINVFAAQLITGHEALEVQAMRGLAAGLIAGAIAIAFQRRADDWQMQVSRTVAMQSLSVLGVILYLVLLVAGSGLIETLGGGNARIFQAAFVIGATATLLTLISSPWLRAWVKVKLAKHLFRHRYDYRTEWLRFTQTLGRPDAAESLEQRCVKAIADLVHAPAGLLLVAEDRGLGIGAGWNWPSERIPLNASAATLAEHLAETGRVIELDAVRRNHSGRADAVACPQWMLDLDEAWAIVPLPHLDRLAGAVLLARPPIDRALDWEDFDLLKVAGRQVASYLAEASATAALMEAQRFEEFNRRFAFILHDLKNLVSQLTLVARNAERHADNPDFRADMVATLQDSAARMNELLARLSMQGRPRAEVLRAVELVQLIEGIAAARRHQHPIATSAATRPLALADPGRLEQLLAHLVQNAVEASPADEPVTIIATEAGDRVTIDVIDRGCGMSPAFIRDQLFRPFASSKPNGFGIGAYEARELAKSMGGSIEVYSRPGKGSRFRVTLKSAATGSRSMEQAA